MTLYGARTGFTLDRADGRKAGGGVALNVQRYLNAPAYFDTPKGRAVERYFAEDLGLRDTGPYTNLALVGGDNWDTNDGAPRQPFDNVDMATRLAEDVAQNPRLRVMMAAGYFDLATPWFASQSVLATHDLPATRVVRRHYKSGHGILNDQEATQLYRQDLRDFVTPA